MKTYFVSKKSQLNRYPLSRFLTLLMAFFALSAEAQNKDGSKNANALMCFNNKSGVALERTTDLDGKSIEAFPLDRLRSNVRYGFVENYREGMARIKKDQVWGFLNLCGEEYIPAQYEEAEPFNFGKALVKKYNWFFVDNNGVESDVFENIVAAKALSNGFSMVKIASGKYSIIDNSFDKTGTYLSPFYDEMTMISPTSLAVKLNNKWGIMKLGDKKPPVPIFDLIAPIGKEGLMKIKVGEKFGVATINGDILLKPEYGILTDVDTQGFIKGIEENKQQVFNSNNLQVSKSFKAISDFDSRGLAIVQDDNNLLGLINKDFQTIITPQFTSIGSLGEFDLIPVSKVVDGKGVKFGFINLQGKEVIPIIYEAVGKINKKGLLVVKEVVSCNLDAKGSKIGTCKADKVIDVNGGIIVQPVTKYPDAGKINYAVTDSTIQNMNVIKTFRADDKGKNMKIILVREDDFKVITPEAFEAIQPTNQGQILFVKLDGLWGTLEVSGRYITKCQFKTFAPSKEDYFLVQNTAGKYGYVDAKGKIQVNPEYQSLEPFSNGLAVASKGVNQVGLINKFNAKVAPCIFSTVSIDSAGNYDLTDSSQNKFKLNKQGDCLSNCAKFDEVRSKVNKE
ncbi:MAG: WG repeat-containing protein [Flectobacillus sp.]|uniref:WG repeat-containing protein n=1 Tax=Flectobacillus sp. TaxID=50419 RepID=UPI003B992E2A